MAAMRRRAFSRTARLFTSGVTLIPPALVLGLVLSAEARAKDTGYVFVSHEKTNNIAVIDPKQDYKVIKWIPTSRRPRDMKFRDDHRLLYVACGDDDVIDMIDLAPAPQGAGASSRNGVVRPEGHAGGFATSL
jgi:DNA-binding beta-propeller fold protein YncE